jgi:ankyrin repeat protein
MVRAYLREKGGRGDELTDDGFSLLHVVSELGSVAALDEVIKNGANIDVRSRGDSMPPLVYAARWGRANAVSWLLGAGARSDVTDGKGRTALGYAAYCGYPDVALTLLEKGADVEKLMAGRLTPLSLAAAGGHLDVVRVLLRHGANPGALGLSGATAGQMNLVALMRGLDGARSGNAPSAGLLATVPDSTRLAIADVLAHWSATVALATAVSRRDVAATRAAMLAGASPYERLRSGSSALFIAASLSDTAALRLMLNPPGATAAARDTRPGARREPAPAPASRVRAPIPDTSEVVRARRRARDSASFAMLLAVAPRPGPEERTRLWWDICDSNQTGRARALQAAGAMPPPKEALTAAARVASRGPLEVLLTGRDTSWKDFAGVGISRVQEIVWRIYDPKVAAPHLEIAAMIIKRAGPKADMGNTGTPVLHWAIQDRDEALVKLALDAGLDPTRRYDGQTPLEHALARGYAPSIELLRGRAPAVDPRDHALLVRAAESGDVSLVQQFVRARADLVGSGAFERAATRGMTAVVTAMLEDPALRAQLRVPYHIGYARLVNAMRGEGDDRMVTLLAANGAELDVDPNGAPGEPLVWAARRNKPLAIEALVKAGARVRGPTPTNALLCQILVGYVLDRRREQFNPGFVVPLEGVQAVLSQGAEIDPRGCDLYGTDVGTPLHVLAAGLVRDKGYGWEPVIAREKQLLAMLVAAGANVEARTRNGKTPIDLARARHDNEMVEWLRRARK